MAFMQFDKGRSSVTRNSCSRLDAICSVATYSIGANTFVLSPKSTPIISPV